ncbi:hypothetical protein [Halocatena pleomorpha]|uniref:Uncharacterized protein n=1 Tax=Halocatena pleomorpha TaxID=1785090 RepID=A0A3P3R8Y8_9EURY|nr:hypothetical protein [Halocatena pleomorpha]RRJ29932.1 hypothetical protein EIK79_11285 [Halocatena pleomorpha]
MPSQAAYLALPGPSVTTILLNVPDIMRFSRSTPLILMDQHDYDQLRAELLTGEIEGKKAPYLLTAYEELRRRGVIRLIDYAKFYSPSIQKRYLRQNQAVLQDAPDWMLRQAALKASEGWIQYGRGSYQESFRGTLGETEDAVNDLRRQDEKQHRKLKCGSHNPLEWNEKVLNKGIAALSIAHQVNQTLNVNVRGIIAHTGFEMIHDFLEQSRRGTLTTDLSDIEHLKPKYRITGFDANKATQTRALLDTVSTIATEIAGVQHTDWFLLGPSFAVPQYQQLFGFENIYRQINRELNKKELITETKKVIDVLENNGMESVSQDEMRYDAGWVAEQFDLPTGFSGTQKGGPVDLIRYMTTLSTYSRELRTLIDRNTVSQAAALIGANIARNPHRQYDDNDIYHLSVRQMVRLDPPAVDERELEAVHKERGNATWQEHTDWFETLDRDR